MNIQKLGFSSFRLACNARNVCAAAVDDTLTLGMIEDLEAEIHDVEILRSQLVLAADPGMDIMLEAATLNLNIVKGFVATLYGSLVSVGTYIN